MMIIDRFEGETAVIEDGENRLEIEKSLLPPEAEEGDVIVFEAGVYAVDKEETKKRRAEALALLRKLGL